MFQLKLNEVINPEASAQKGFALLQSIRNSFKRNRISSQHNTVMHSQIQPHSHLKDCLESFQSPDLQYESQLSSFHFSSHDLNVLLTYLYSKQKLNKSDRNLIRRVLLSIFSEGLIVNGGGRDLIRFLGFRSLQKTRKFIVADENDPYNNQRCFYLLLAGKVKVVTPIYEKEFASGSYFGDLQLSSFSNDTISQIHSITNTSLLFTIPSQYYFAHFHPYLQSLQSQKDKSVAPLNDLLQLILPVLRKMFISELQPHVCSAGTRLSKKGQKMSHLFFVGSKFRISSSENRLLTKYRTVGLFETMNSHTQYTESLYCLQEMNIHKIQVQKFKNYFDQKTLAKLNKTFVQEVLCHLVNEVLQPEQKINKFMKMRMVKLSHNKKIKDGRKDRNGLLRGIGEENLSINTFLPGQIRCKDNGQTRRPVEDGNYQCHRGSGKFHGSTGLRLKSLQTPTHQKEIMKSTQTFISQFFFIPKSKKSQLLASRQKMMMERSLRWDQSKTLGLGLQNLLGLDTESSDAYFKSFTTTKKINTQHYQKKGNKNHHTTAEIAKSLPKMASRVTKNKKKLLISTSFDKKRREKSTFRQKTDNDRIVTSPR